MIYTRYMTPAGIRQNAVIVPLSDEPMRRYLGLNSESTGVNMHPVIANYFRDLVFAIDPEGPAVSVTEALRTSALYRALYGNGVLLRTGYRVRAIDPRYWWPVLVRGVKVGSILVMPYQDSTPTNGLSTALPDRAWVVLANDAEPVATSMIYEYSGVTLGRLLSSENISPLSVGVWGDGVSEFTLAGTWALDEISARTQGLSVVLSRFEKPHLQAPASAVTYDTNGEPRLELSSEGSVLPVQPNDKSWQYLTLDADSPLHSYHISSLFGTISANTSIPLSVFGHHSVASRAETGAAFMIEDYEAFAKAKVWRRNLVDACNQLGYTLSWPEELPQPDS